MKIIKTEFVKGNTEFYDFDISIVFFNGKDLKKNGYYITFLPIFKYENHFDKLNDFKTGRQLSSNNEEDDELLYKILKSRTELYEKYIAKIESMLKENHLNAFLNVKNDDQSSVKTKKLKENSNSSTNIKYANTNIKTTDDESKDDATQLRDIEKKIISYHEAGHALVGYLLGKTNIKKISIIPNSESLGYISNSSSNKPYLYTETELFNKIKFLLAGKVAEELIFKEHSTGCYDDLKKSSQFAIDMVCKYAMGSDASIFVNPVDENEITPSNMRRIESILNKADKSVLELLKEYKIELDKIANELYNKKEISVEYIQEIVIKK